MRGNIINYRRRMRKIKNIKDIVDWGLCTGCGACSFFCKNKAISLKNIPFIGIRPIIDNKLCQNCCDCLSICPGYAIDVRKDYNTIKNDLIGSYLEIWEGYAADDEIRFRASSGGIISALACYCLEVEKMGLVLHTSMDESIPWQNRTSISTNKNQIINGAGSRYAPSSPCANLQYIKDSKQPCVVIGKPCDIAAVSMLRKYDEVLDKNIGLLLTFFCAGVPSTKGTKDLIEKLGINLERVTAVHYRGNGWPGDFRVSLDDSGKEKRLSYRNSWHILQKYRSFRCNLCPDGLGETADIASGDAWHRFKEEDNIINNGISVIIVRSEKGKELLHKAAKARYIYIIPSDYKNVIKAQGLVTRRKELFGRIFSMKILCIPVTRFKGFKLFKAWRKNSFIRKIFTISGTLWRLLKRGLWHKKKIGISKL